MDRTNGKAIYLWLIVGLAVGVIVGFVATGMFAEANLSPSYTVQMTYQNNVDAGIAAACNAVNNEWTKDSGLNCLAEDIKIIEATQTIEIDCVCVV